MAVTTTARIRSALIMFPLPSRAIRVYAREPRIQSFVPETFMGGLPGVKSGIKKLLVIWHLQMRELQPHSRRIKGVHMRREPPVGLVNVAANLLGISNRFRGIMRAIALVILGILDVAVGKFKNGEIAVGSPRAVFG